MRPLACLDRLLTLTDFRGGPALAFRALHDYLRELVEGVGLALCTSLDGEIHTVWLSGFIDVAGLERVTEHEGARGGQRRLMFQEALAARIIGADGPTLITPGQASQQGALANLLDHPETILVMPMNNWQRNHYWLLFTSADPAAFDALDLLTLWKESKLAFALLGGGFLEDQVAAHERTIGSLADIQRLLQPECPDIRGITHAFHWQPAETAAGDYFDLMRLSHIHQDYADSGADAWGALIADVSGHGPAAAMEAVQLDAILRTYQGGEAPGGPAGAVTYANKHFFSRRERQHFLTAYGLSGRPDQGRLQYVSAGHLPMLRRRGAELDFLGLHEQSEIPIGVMRGYRWENQEDDLRSGDLLVLYTDGVTEARDALERMFGLERLQAAVMRAKPDAHAVVAEVCEALFEHQGSEFGQDDQTLLVIQQH